jgi:glutamine amidotransferase
VGKTDSEAALCALLETLRAAYPGAKPPLPELVAALAGATERLAARGPFNYLLSDGDHLFAHCATRLHYIVRQAPFAAAHLVDEDVTVDFNELTTPRDRVSIIATTPLTDNEEWVAIPQGKLVVFHDGAPVEVGPPAAEPAAI